MRGLVFLALARFTRARHSADEPTHHNASHDDPKVSGGDVDEATPDPISNSEVKLIGADGTAREAVWESRTLPGNSSLRNGPIGPAKAPILRKQGRGFCVSGPAAWSNARAVGVLWRGSASACRLPTAASGGTGAFPVGAISREIRGT